MSKTEFAHVNGLKLVSWLVFFLRYVFFFGSNVYFVQHVRNPFPSDQGFRRHPVCMTQTARPSLESQFTDSNIGLLSCRVESHYMWK